VERLIQLQLETTGVCNARCHFCVYKDVPSDMKGLMPMGKYKALVDEAATVPILVSLVLHGLGESLLDPHMDERIMYARKVLPPEVVTSMFSNGSLLTPTRFEQLKEAGLHDLNISLNAVSAEQRKDVMGLDDFDKVINYVSYAIKNRGDMKVRITAVVNEDRFNMTDAGHLVALWGRWGEGGHVELVREGNWAGENRTTRPFDPAEACGRALHTIYVRSNGDAVTCCFDPLGKFNVWGNVFEDGLRAVYGRPAWVAFREAHSQNKADQFSYCKECTRI